MLTSLLAVLATAAPLAPPAPLAFTLVDSGRYEARVRPGGGQEQPAGIATDTFGHVWVTDEAGDRVQRWDASGVWLDEFGSLGSDPNQFRSPTALARLGSSGVAVLDVENRRVVRYDLLGRLVGVLVQLDDPALEAQTDRITPIAIAADRGGALYVADGDQDRILVFDWTGQFLRTLGSHGLAPGSFHGLQSLAITPHGEIVTIEGPVPLPRKGATAADSAAAAGARIQRIESGGAPLAAWSLDDGDRGPYAIAVDESGRLAIAEEAAGRVRLWSAAGEPLAVREGLEGPRALAFAPDGSLLVAEAAKARVRRLVLLTAAAKE